MKVHMTNITTAGGRVRQTNLSIQIRSVEIHLATICVDDIACLLDAVLEYAEGRWVCDLGDEIRPGTSAVLRGDAYHESCEVIFVLHCLRTQVRDVEATIRQTLHRDHLQAGHDGGLRVFQCREVTTWNNSLTAGFVPCALTGMRQISL